MKKWHFILSIFLCYMFVNAQNSEEIKQLKNELDSIKQIVRQLTYDADQDGVPDYYDKEKNTPFKARVDGAGVALDVDLDGVIDLEDKCVVNQGPSQMNGCPICGIEEPSRYVDLTKDIFDRLQFQYLQTELSTDDKKKIDKAMESLQYFDENISLFIESSSNDYSNFKKNYVISKIRAQNVYNYIIEKFPQLQNKIFISAKGDKKLFFEECKNKRQCQNPEDSWKNTANNNVNLQLRMNDKD